MQSEYISNLLKENKGAIFVGSLGTISKDLFEAGTTNDDIVLVKGAMGCVMGVGLGIALNTKKRVIVLIGDGAFIMKMGSMATIAKYAPENLEVIIINNGKHQSCGGQPTAFNELMACIKSLF